MPCPVTSVSLDPYGPRHLALDPSQHEPATTPLLQLELLPLLPTPNYASLGIAPASPVRDIDVNEIPSTIEEDDAGETSATPGYSMVSVTEVPFKSERERILLRLDENQKICDVSSRVSDRETESGSTRKKLKLSKQQSALLEESFNGHPTLNPKQKAALAKRLGLRPRQVEVWFQNRRARSKLKQTEVECESVKKLFQSLVEENRRLQKEVRELRAVKAGPSSLITGDILVPLQFSTLTMCACCARIGTSASCWKTAGAISATAAGELFSPANVAVNSSSKSAFVSFHAINSNPSVCCTAVPASLSLLPATRYHDQLPIQQPSTAC